MSYLSGKFFCLTDQGKVRPTNDDSAITSINAFGNVLLAVADGMGGAKKGGYASCKLLEHILNEFRDLEKELVTGKQIANWLFKVIASANEKLYLISEKNEEYKGMGTTLSLCMLVKDILVTAQVGDSRIYLLRENKLTKISVDQTYVQYLIDNGMISEKEALSHKERHVLTNAIGVKKVCQVDIKEHVYNNEKILLCSDGLYNNVSPTVLESILRGDDSLERKCSQLIAFGNASGGTDNMAVVIWESDN